MKSALWIVQLLLAGTAVAAESCTGPNNQPGICLPAANCSSSGGTTGSGTCSVAGEQCCTYGTCTVSGVPGRCQPTSTCTGTRNSGYCPGDATIQCCTFGRCTSAAGVPGSCVHNSLCQAGGTRSSGRCPGPNDVQCCDYGRCTANGVGGFCQSTATCGGTSTGGLCPGPADVKCCTTSSSGGNCTNGVPPVNTATVALIVEFEGRYPDIYIDPTGNPTVGIGHLCTQPNCAEVPYPIPLSDANMDKLLQDDLLNYRTCLANAVSRNVTLNANQYGALVSWTFNMGCNAMRTSTLLVKLNNGTDPNLAASVELPKWVYGGGVVLPGLVRRRDAEVRLFQLATNATGLPPKCCTSSRR